MNMKAQQGLEEICAVKQQLQEQLQKSHKQDILQKTSPDRSIDLCVPRDAYHKLFCVFGDFSAAGMQGRRGDKVTAFPLEK